MDIIMSSQSQQFLHPFSSSHVRQASGGLRAEIVHLREVRNAVNAMPPEAGLQQLRMIHSLFLCIYIIVILYIYICIIYELYMYYICIYVLYMYYICIIYVLYILYISYVCYFCICIFIYIYVFIYIHIINCISPSFVC